MKEYFFEGKTEEEALLRASGELGLNISSMKYEIVEKESKIFGLLGKNVKIRVIVEEYEEKEGLKTTEKSKGEKAKDTLLQILKKMDIEAEIKLEEDDEKITLNIITDEEELVIGKDGKNLSALQFIIDKIVNKFPEIRKKIILDSKGYRGKRQEHLFDVAKKLGEKAKKSNKIIRIYSMTPYDRRIIHLALKDMDGITTESEGSGIFRKLLIIPENLRRREDFRGRRRFQGERQSEAKTKL